MNRIARKFLNRKQNILELYIEDIKYIKLYIELYIENNPKIIGLK